MNLQNVLFLAIIIFISFFFIIYKTNFKLDSIANNNIENNNLHNKNYPNIKDNSNRKLKNSNQINIEPPLDNYSEHIKVTTHNSVMCKIDLNGDKADDFVFLVKGWKAFVMLTKDNKYQLHFITIVKPDDIIAEYLLLSCRKGNHIIETPTGPGNKELKDRTFRVPTNSYFEIIEPECCSVAYYWKDNGFQQVWTAD